VCPQDETDDAALWAKLTKTVTPADREDVLFQTKAKPQGKPLGKAAAKPKAKLTDDGKAVVKPAVKTMAMPADLRAKRPELRAGIDNASARRLTKGSFTIDGSIDLHGRTEATAHQALVRFIQQAVQQEARTLLVITGKGAKGQGILRRKVPEWLKDYPLKAHILAFSEASPKDGGSGAYYVRLRRKRDVL
jgi:DNA-nicking Smr family endonuclease